MFSPLSSWRGAWKQAGVVLQEPSSTASSKGGQEQTFSSKPGYRIEPGAVKALAGATPQLSQRIFESVPLDVYHHLKDMG